MRNNNICFYVAHYPNELPTTQGVGWWTELDVVQINTKHSYLHSSSYHIPVCVSVRPLCELEYFARIFKEKICELSSVSIKSHEHSNTPNK